MRKRARNGVARILQMMAVIAIIMLVTPNISVVPIEFSKYVAAETPELSVQTEYTVLRWTPSTEWDAAFQNATYYQNQTFSATSGTYHETGYMKTKASADSTEYANRNLSIASGSSYAMFEMMYCAVSKDAQDHFQMNLTLNRTVTNAYDFDNLAIGNEYNVPTVWYKDATDNQTIDLGFTFEEDVWYVAILYINDNYTADAEMRWASNYTVAGSAHISALNLSLPENVTLMNITNNNAAGGEGNEYWLEYTFYRLADDFSGFGDSSANTAFGRNFADDKTSISKIFDKTMDADASTDHGNMSAGTNNSDALRKADFFNNGAESAPATRDALAKSNNSWYSTQDVKHICGMTPEKNDSFQHKQAAEWSFTDNFQEYLLNDVRAQFNKDKDEGVFVDHRVNTLNFTIVFPEDYREQVQEDFKEGLEDTNADIEACWLDPTMNAEGGGWFSGLSGTFSDVTNAATDGMENVWENSMGFFGGSSQGAGDWLSGGIFGMGDSAGSMSDGLFSFTNSAIGGIVDGAASFTAGISDFIASTAGQLITAPFSFLMALTGKIILWVVLVIIGITILVLFLVWRKSAASHEGGKTAKADIKSGA